MDVAVEGVRPGHGRSRERDGGPSIDAAGVEGPVFCCQRVRLGIGVADLYDGTPRNGSRLAEREVGDRDRRRRAAPGGDGAGSGVVVVGRRQGEQPGGDDGADRADRERWG